MSQNPCPVPCLPKAGNTSSITEEGIPESRCCLYPGGKAGKKVAGVCSGSVCVCVGRWGCARWEKAERWGKGKKALQAGRPPPPCLFFFREVLCACKQKEFWEDAFIAGGSQKGVCVYKGNVSLESKF